MALTFTLMATPHLLGMAYMMNAFGLFAMSRQKLQNLQIDTLWQIKSSEISHTNKFDCTKCGQCTACFWCI